MENLIDNFTKYLLDLGLIKSKSEIFILNRRYTLMEKQFNQKHPEHAAKENATLDWFIHWSKDILTDFFEERADEVVVGVVDRWLEKQDENILQQQNKLENNFNQLIKLFKRTNQNKALKHAFDQWRVNSKVSDKQKYFLLYNEERESRLIAEASLTALQVELKEALERISKMEKKEQKRIERKKK